MLVDREWLSATKMTGLAAYTTALAACIWRWATCEKRGVTGQLFAGLAAVQFGLLVDMAFDLRWKLHGFVDDAALAAGVYDQRSMPQLLALVVMSLALVLVSIFILHRFHRRLGAGLALTGTFVSVGLWCCECISYNYVDSLLYYSIWKVMVVGLLWIGVALVTCVGVWLDGLSQGRRVS